MSDDDRIAYLSGELTDALSPSERAELDEVRRLLADPAMWAAPDPGLEQRIVDDIAGAAQPDELAARRAHRGRMWLIAAAAAVVALLAGIGIGVAVGGNGGGNSPVHRQQFAAALQPTPLEPNASGQATLTKFGGGWRINIHASGLPRRDNGRYYEAWLKNAAGVLVPIGTFNRPSHVVLWAGVPPSDFPLLTITRQTVGGGEDSSGQVVLSGQTRQVR